MPSRVQHTIGDIAPVSEDRKNDIQADGNASSASAPSAEPANIVSELSETSPPPNGTPFKLGDFCIDEYRPLKVVVIGTGFSGILAGIRCGDQSYVISI